MNGNEAAITEADIPAQVISPDQPGLPVETAQTILELRFGSSAIDRMNELAEKNRQNSLMDVEKDEHEKYQQVGHFLNLMQAKAHLFLKEATSS